MLLTISSLYSEPGISFKISYKTIVLITKLLREYIMKPYGLDDKDQDMYLGLIISTYSKCDAVEIKGPSYDKRNKTINYGLFLPYNTISEKQDQNAAFINELFKGLAIVFERYQVKQSDINGVKVKAECEVVGNSYYNFTDQKFPPPDLSGIIGI